MSDTTISQLAPEPSPQLTVPVCGSHTNKRAITRVTIVVALPLLVLGVGLAVLLTAGTDTVPSCYKWSTNQEYFGNKCYHSGYGYTCANDPCYCVNAMFTYKCLPAPPGQGDNPQLIAGIALVCVGSIAVIGAAIYAFVAISTSCKSAY